MPELFFTTKPDLALPNCQHAIELAPDHNYYDSRVLAYALSGDLSAEIADFQKYVDFIESSNNPELAQGLEKRKEWITDLKAVRIPLPQRC